MNVLFVLFTINAVISTVSADEDCYDIANRMFAVLKKLTSYLTNNEIASQVYSDSFRPFFFGNLSKCTVQYLILPHELEVCKKFAHSVADKPEVIESINIETYTPIIENMMSQRYDADPDEICTLIPTEGENFLQKVKDLINKKTTLDHFCKANKGVRRCNVTDDVYTKFIAYISYGYNPTFEPFVETVIHSRELFDSIFHGLSEAQNNPMFLRLDNDYLKKFTKDLKSCVNELFHYMVIAILNAKHN